MRDEKRVPYQLSMIDHDGVDRIHAATLQVLSETGAYYESVEVIALLSGAGAQADENGQVRLPPDLAEWAIASAPQSWPRAPFGCCAARRPVHRPFFELRSEP